MKIKIKPSRTTTTLIGTATRQKMDGTYEAFGVTSEGPQNSAKRREAEVRRELMEQLKRAARRELASAGGKARAQKYSKATLSKWAKKGGRPRKKEK